MFPFSLNDRVSLAYLLDDLKIEVVPLRQISTNDCVRTRIRAQLDLLMASYLRSLCYTRVSGRIIENMDCVAFERENCGKQNSEKRAGTSVI